MFASERELVEKLVIDLQERYDTRYIVRELRGGNNRADIVYTTNINRDNIIFEEYFNAYYYFNQIYNHKKVRIDEVGSPDIRVNRKFKVFLKELEELGYIRIDDNYITSIKRVDTVTKNFIAIEAKLSDWRSGLEQARRYKQYANEVYVAISSAYVDKVDREVFKKENIGLMSVSEGKLKVSIKAKREKVKKPEIKYYMEERFLKQLKIK